MASDVVLARLEHAARGRPSARVTRVEAQARQRARVLAWRETRRRRARAAWEASTFARTPGAGPFAGSGEAGWRLEVDERIAALPDEARAVVLLLRRGYRLAECARLLGLRVGAVRARVERACAAVAGPRPRADDRLRRPPPPGPARDAWLLRLVAAGHRPAELAEALGVSAGALRTRLCRLRRRMRGAGGGASPAGACGV